MIIRPWQNVSMSVEDFFFFDKKEYLMKLFTKRWRALR